MVTMRVHVSQFTVVLLTRQKRCVQQQDTLVALHVWATESSQEHTNIHPLGSGQNKRHVMSLDIEYKYSGSHMHAV